MYRNMVTSLMLHGRIQTTEAKAKELRRVADRIITLGKRVPQSSLESLSGDALADARAQRVHAIRQARRYIVNRDALDLVFGEYAERFKERPGGYTRIYKLGFRAGDNAPMSLIELLPAGEGEVAAASPPVETAVAAAEDDTGAEE